MELNRYRLGQAALDVEPSLYKDGLTIAVGLTSPRIEAAILELGPRVAWSLNWTKHGWITTTPKPLASVAVAPRDEHGEVPGLLF